MRLHIISDLHLECGPFTPPKVNADGYDDTSEQPHPLVVLLVPGKRLIFGPPFLFQICNDVQPRRRRGLVTPKFAHLLNACKVMAQFAVAHPVGRLARKLIQPAMHLFKRLPQHRCRFRAVFCERRHKPFSVQEIPAN